MSSPDSKIGKGNSGPVKAEESTGERRQNDTFTRLRTALLEERLALMERSSEDSGTDPYNSGIRRTTLEAPVWNKRSR